MFYYNYYYFIYIIISDLIISDFYEGRVYGQVNVNVFFFQIF